MSPPRRVIFVNRFFYPDHSATSQVLSELCFALAPRGFRVHVVTSRLGYEKGLAELPADEVINGVSVTRVWTSRFGRASLAGRLIDYLTFYPSAGWALIWLVRRGDIVVTKTDPPMISSLTGFIARLRGARRINWLQDVFPEVAERVALGGVWAKPAWAVARRWRNRSLKLAQCNVVIGQRMAELVRSIGVTSDAIRIIANANDGKLIRPVARDDNALRKAWGLADKLVVGYSGNLGRAHDVETILSAMQHLVAMQHGPAPHVAWLFIGGGAQTPALEAGLAQVSRSDVLIKPYQPREKLAESLSVADVHLVSLKPELEGLIVPSKIYGVMAAGRPCIFIGDPDGEVGRLITQHGIGLVVRVGDGKALADAILHLAQSPDIRRAMGETARVVFDSEFDSSVATERWCQLLAEVGAAQPASL